MCYHHCHTVGITTFRHNIRGNMKFLSGPQAVIRKLLDDSAPDVILVALVDLGPPSASLPSNAVRTSDGTSSTESSIFATDTLSSLPLRSALVRAFKSVVSAIANIAGPREFGLGPLPHKSDTAAVARQVLEQIFQVQHTIIANDLPTLTVDS